MKFFIASFDFVDKININASEVADKSKLYSRTPSKMSCDCLIFIVILPLRNISWYD